MTSTTHSVGPRVDTEIEVGEDEDWRFWYRTHYPDIDLYVVTSWWGRWEHFPSGAATAVTEGLTGLPGTIYQKDYDPVRVTVGGLAEAHEAVCARVERGELP